MNASPPGPDLNNWIQEGHEVVLDLADMLNVPPDIYMNNPLKLFPALQNYVSRLPLDQFEQSDWITFQTDLMACLADFLIRTHGAHWIVVDDAQTPRGYRYVIEARGLDGILHKIDPVDVVRLEFRNQPIDVVRMLASAEKALHLTSAAAN